MPMPTVVATLHYDDGETKPRTFLAPYKPYFCKTKEGRRAMKIYFSRLYISPGGYKVDNVLDQNTKEHYDFWMKIWHYRIHPHGTFEFEDEKLKKILMGDDYVENV